ncbi:hypothetical protein IJH46_03345 [Candidatus Saccharibacteria bacterium]|nr:hypothetical protein [Candidatus Saccharibacteria bacterium]
MSRKFDVNLLNNFEPEKCWVGDKHKVCYATADEAEVAARVAEYDHHLPADSLSVYRCEFGNHWHLCTK